MEAILYTDNLCVQAKAMAIEAATAQMRAANASLKAVEDGIQLHATNRDYGKLKETAEASGLAARVRRAFPPPHFKIQEFSIPNEIPNPECNPCIFRQ